MIGAITEEQEEEDEADAARAEACEGAWLAHAWRGR